MVDLVRDKLPEVEELCRRYGVRELQLFGSATGEEFDSERSDIDLVVEMSAPGFQVFFDFHDALERLFERKVDLLEKQAIKNPYMVRAIKSHREYLFAA